MWILMASRSLNLTKRLLLVRILVDKRLNSQIGNRVSVVVVVVVVVVGEE